MAIASVPATHTHLPDPLVTEATRLLSQSRAIVELIHAGGNHVDDRETLPSACWALSDMLSRVSQIVQASTEVSHAR